MLTPKRMTVVAAVVALALGLGVNVAHAQEEAQNREQIDDMAQNTLDRLFAEEPTSQSLFEQAYGYAVFNSYEVAAGVTAGGGNGVAVNKETNERTYMDMGTAGLSLGLGGQNYQLVMLFETEDRFNEFVTDGWEFGAGAAAVAGEAGSAVGTTFKNGMVIFPMTDEGLLLEADLTGSKFWVDEEMNQQQVGMSREGHIEGMDEEGIDLRDTEADSADPGVLDVTTQVEAGDQIDMDEDPEFGAPKDADELQEQ